MEEESELGLLKHMLVTSDPDIEDELAALACLDEMMDGVGELDVVKLWFISVDRGFDC